MKILFEIIYGLALMFGISTIALLIGCAIVGQLSKATGAIDTEPKFAPEAESDRRVTHMNFNGNHFDI